MDNRRAFNTKPRRKEAQDGVGRRPTSGKADGIHNPVHPVQYGDRAVDPVCAVFDDGDFFGVMNHETRNETTEARSLSRGRWFGADPVDAASLADEEARSRHVI